MFDITWAFTYSSPEEKALNKWHGLLIVLGRLMVELGDLEGLFQAKWFHDSIIATVLLKRT